jgi:hypothetical protein
MVVVIHATCSQKARLGNIHSTPSTVITMTHIRQLPLSPLYLPSSMQPIFKSCTHSLAESALHLSSPHHSDSRITSVSRPKPNTRMGKVKSMMQSLRSRFSSLKYKSTTSAAQSSSVSCFTVSSSSSLSILQTPPSSVTGTNTSPTSTPKMPPTVQEHDATSDSSFTVHVAVDIVCVGDPDEYADRFVVSTRVESRASMAMLDFARNLPLSELSLIGCGLEAPAMEPYSVTDPDGVEQTSRAPNTRAPTIPFQKASLSQVSSESFPTRRTKREHDLIAPRSAMAQLQHTRSQTLSISSRSSSSTWSFACQSARRVEREYDEQDDNVDDDASPFGSLSERSTASADDARPNRSDAENIPEQNKPCKRTTGVQPVSLLTEETDGSSHTPQVSEQNSNLGDAAFDALPDWSDIENDPEYNEPFKREADMWSVTSIASSDAGSKGQGLFANL